MSAKVEAHNHHFGGSSPSADPPPCRKATNRQGGSPFVMQPSGFWNHPEGAHVREPSACLGAKKVLLTIAMQLEEGLSPDLALSFPACSEFRVSYTSPFAGAKHLLGKLPRSVLQKNWHTGPIYWDFFSSIAFWASRTMFRPGRKGRFVRVP